MLYVVDCYCFFMVVGFYMLDWKDIVLDWFVVVCFWLIFVVCEVCDFVVVGIVLCGVDMFYCFFFC